MTSNTTAGAAGCLRSRWDALPSLRLLLGVKRADLGKGLGSVSWHAARALQILSARPTETHRGLGDSQGHVSQPLHSGEEPGDGYVTSQCLTPSCLELARWPKRKSLPMPPNTAPTGLPGVRRPFSRPTDHCPCSARPRSDATPPDSLHHSPAVHGPPAIEGPKPTGPACSHGLLVWTGSWTLRK